MRDGLMHMIPAILLAVVLGTAETVWAEDEDARESDSSPQQPASDSPLDDELLKRLVPGAQGDEDDEAPLERAIRRMRAAMERISERDTSDETQELQRQAVKDLEELIKLAQQQQSRQPSPSDSQQQQDQQDQDDAQGQAGADEGGQAGEEPDADMQDAADADIDSSTPQDDPRDSSDRSDRPSRAEQELSHRDQLAKDVWGHLPPQLREELRNIYAEKYLPKYDDLVRRYYEALAEQGRRDRDE